MEAARVANKPLNDSDFLNHKSSVTEQFADYDPKRLSAMSVTGMIRTIAQMRNPRRGHDAQGHVKKVNLDDSSEGYSNYMAPMRVARISQQVDMIDGNTDDIYSKKILRPATDTYLTAEWDEFVPFPNTWKIRFDGFGKSDYSKAKESFGALKQPKINIDALAAPPFYQPKGPSCYGGSFADMVCVCNQPGKECHCKDANAGDAAAASMKVQIPAGHEVSISTGCGVGS
jgi:hypothetical protein